MTRFDKLLEGLKNSRPIAMLLLLGLGLVAIGNAVDALEKFKSLLGHGRNTQPTKIDVYVRDERPEADSLERLRLERALRILEYEFAKSRRDLGFLNDFEKVRAIEEKAAKNLTDIESSAESSSRVGKIENVITALRLTIGAIQERDWSSKPEAARVSRHLEEMLLQAQLLKEKSKSSAQPGA